MNFYRINIFDIILIIFILLISTGFIVYSNTGAEKESIKNYKVSVYKEGILIKKISLDRNQEINFADKGMILESKPGKIRVKTSNCSHKICVNTGWIKMPGQIIACVPNRIVLEIISKQDNFLDAVVE